LARAFVAKMVIKVPTTSMLIEHLGADKRGHISHDATAIEAREKPVQIAAPNSSCVIAIYATARPWPAMRD
jgi:hypothetical protein